MTSEKNYSAESSYFVWEMAQSAGTSGRDYGGGEFTIWTFIKRYIIRANQR